jgi:mono/diheme cytochrome c family protein
MQRQAHRMVSLAGLGVLLAAIATDISQAQTSAMGGIREDFHRYCAGCHGNGGDGQGENAAWIDPKPRDFTAAVFKCRSTPSGTLPTDEDLAHSIKRGFVNSNMPSWKPLPDATVGALVQYIKTFSPRWQKEKPGTPIEIPPEPAPTLEGIIAGRATFQKLECWKCHGPEGKGDGPSAASLTDSKDQPIKPFDFHDGTRFKCGSTDQDIYRDFMTGLDGTPMASFSDNLKPNDAWNLVHFLRTLQPLPTPELAMWKQYVTTHAAQIKPIGADNTGQ